MKKILIVVLVVVAVFAFATTAFASESIDNDADYTSEVARLNSQKQFFEEKYLEMLELEKDEADIEITYDQEVTPELLKLSEASAVKIQTVNINITPSLTMESRSGTQSWDKAGTYLCDGQYFYVYVRLGVNVLTKDSREYYQLSNYKLKWQADNPLIGSNDPNGYCYGTNEEAIIRQYGIKYSTERLGSAAQINLTYGPHASNLNGFFRTNSWYNREAYSCDGIGGIASLATYHIKTADSVVDGVHNDVHYYIIEDFYVGAGSLP